MIDDIYRSYQYEVDKFSGRKKKESANIGAVEIGKDVNDNVDTAIKLNDDEFDNSTEVSRLSVNIDTIKKIFDSDLNLKIVWVTMDEHTIYRDHISGSHINRPFVIVSENKDSVSGFYTTSNLNNIRFRNNMVSKYKVVFKYGKYNIDKSPLILHDTLVNLPKKNVGRNILNLDSRDVSQLIKKACLYRNINLISSGNDELIQVGDIIENNGDEYFVYQKDNSMVYGIKFKRYEKEDKNISESIKRVVDDKYVYIFKYNNVVQLSKKNTLLITDFMSQDIANKVLKNMKEYKYNKMASSRGVSIKPTNIDVGYIVRVNNGSNGNSNSNYLIWNKDEEYLYGFKIDKSTKKQATKNKLTYFLADNLLYKAEYDDEIKVLSTDKINIKGILSNDDFGEVLAKRSQYRLVNPSIGNLDGNSEYKQLLKELKKTTY